MKWWVPDKGNSLLASVSCAGNGQKAKEQLRLFSGRAGGQQVKDARTEHLHQTSAQQQPWPNSRPVYKLFCRVTSTCARPGVSLFKENCDEPLWITGWNDQTYIVEY